MFENCYSLEEIVFGNNVRTIDGDAFGNCSHLNKLTIPASVSDIYMDGFQDKSIKLEILGRETNLSFSQNLDELSEEEREEYFNEFSMLELVLYYGSASYFTADQYGLYYECFDSGSSGDNIQWFISDNDELIISGEGSVARFNGFYPWYGVSYRIDSVIIEEGIVNIPEGAFRNIYSLCNVSLPNSLQSIPYSAFESNGKLTSVIIPTGVKIIQERAFGYCSNLEKIVIPENVTEIEQDAFVNCFKLTIYGYSGTEAERFAEQNNIPFVDLLASASRITLPRDTKVVESEAFSNTSAEIYVLPDGTLEIQAYAFGNLNQFARIFLPSSIEVIDDDAFAGSSVRVIAPSGSYAYQWCVQNGIDVIGKD